jgi:hypothetical protein
MIPSIFRAITLAGSLLLLAGMTHAQLVNYGEQMAAYKDFRDAGIKLIDSVTPAVTAKTRVARTLANRSIVDQAALVQPDGTLKLPANQTNLVIRSSYSDVTSGADGQVRIASPSISGNVTGNVTLYVEGKSPENITVLNNKP